MIQLINLVVVGVLFYCATSPAFAVEIAPRLTDREIIEALTELKQGQKSILERFQHADKRIDDVSKRFDDVSKRFDDVSKRFDDVSKRFDDVSKRFDDVSKRFEELRTDTNKRFEELRADTNKRFDGVDKRFEELNKHMDTNHQTMLTIMLAMFGMLTSLIIAIFAYIAWDRRTMVKPLQERLQFVEQNQDREFQEQHSRMKNLLDAVRQLARGDATLISALRSVTML